MKHNPKLFIARWISSRGLRFASAGLFAAAILLWQTSAQAVVVLLRGVDDPVSGYLVSRNDQMIVLDEPTADGQVRRRELPTSTVEEVLVAVDPGRLAELRPQEPQGYRNYA